MTQNKTQIVELGTPELAVQVQGYWVNNGQNEIDAYVASVAKPAIKTQVETLKNQLDNVTTATEQTPGIIRIATPEEVQEGTAVDAVLTPYNAKMGFLDINLFNSFTGQVTEQLATKLDADEQEDLAEDVAALQEILIENEATLDEINT